MTLTYNFLPKDFNLDQAEAAILSPIDLGSLTGDGSANPASPVTWPKFLGILFVGAIGLSLLARPPGRR